MDAEEKQMENVEYVQKGFRVLQPLLSGYIAQEMSCVYRGNGKWWEEVLSLLSDQYDLPLYGDFGYLVDSLDIANCLRLIDRAWREVFGERLQISCRSWAKELMGVRNTVAHIGGKDLPQLDAERALDTMARLCGCFDEEGEEELRGIYNELRYSGMEETDTTASDDEGGFYEKADQTPDFSAGDLNLLAISDTEIVEKTVLTRKLSVGGETKAYPVYRVRLDKLFFNDQNDRIATWITQYNNDEHNVSLDKLTREEYNRIIERFIIESNPSAIEKTKNNIALLNQREPGVILSDGRIVDGNRRFTCLRLLHEESNDFYYFETVILGSATENSKKQVKMLELAIQHGEEQRVDYNQIDMAIGAYHDIVETKLLTVSEYASSTNENVSDVKKRLETAQLIKEFLEFMNVPGQYHVAREKQVFSIFTELIPVLNRCETDKAKEELKTSVFNNTMMGAFSDQRKYIRSVKDLMDSGVYRSYISRQNKINEELAERKKAYGISNKQKLESFIKENDDLLEELRYSMDRSLNQAKKAKTKSKPSQTVEKCIALLMSVDMQIIDKLSDTEKEILHDQLQNLAKIVSMVDREAANQQNSGDRL